MNHSADPKRTSSPADSDQKLNGRPAWRHRLDEFVWGAPDSTTNAFMMWWQRWLQIIDRACRGFLRHDGLSEASALTYITLLTTVPLLAIGLAVFSGFDLHEKVLEGVKKLPVVSQLTAYHAVSDGIGVLAPDEFVGPLAPGENLTGPDSMITGSEMIDKAIAFISSTDIKKLGALGTLGLFLSVLSLLAKIEAAMNRAWSINQRRPPGRMFVDYINMLLVLLLMTIGLSVTVTGRFTNIPGAQTLVNMTPYLIVWPAFMFMYYFIPNMRVRWRSALAGALVAGTLYQLAQYAFTISLGPMFARYDKLYGAFAAVVVLLFWVYVSWGILLWGVEICSVHQNLRDWRRQRRAWHGTPAERETLALRMAVLLARPLISGAASERMDAGDLADALSLPPGPISEIVTLFKDQGVAVECSEDNRYLLSRSPDQLTALDVLRLARTGSLDVKEGDDEGGFLHERTRGWDQPLAELTVHQLCDIPFEKIQTFSL